MRRRHTRKGSGTDQRVAGRERLLRSALKLFATAGFDGASIRKIARGAGLSLGLIRKHFGSKAGLRAAVDQLVLGEMRSLYESHLSVPISADPADWAQRVVDFTRREQDTLLYLRFALLNPRADSQALFDAYHEIQVNFIRALKDQGRLAKGADERWAAFLLMFIQIGVLVIWPYATKVLGRSLFDPRIVMERNRAFVTVLHHGLLKAKRRSGLPRRNRRSQSSKPNTR